jgi:hypothetical protein
LTRRRPQRGDLGTAVFMLGVLAGAGIAAWIVPPL